MNRVRGTVVVALAAGLTACGGGTDDLAQRLDLDAQVRLINVAQQSPSVSLFRGEDSQSFSLNKTYKAVSPYTSVSPGTATWSARTGTAPSTSIASATFDSQRGNRNSLLMVNNVLAYDMILITDPYGKNLTTDRARVRVANTAVNAPAVDVYLTPASDDISTKAPNFNNVTFRQSVPASGADSYEFAPGDYRLQVTTAGSKTVFFAATLNLPSNTDWLLVAIPSSDTSVPGLNSIKFLTVQGNGDANGRTSEIVSAQ